MIKLQRWRTVEWLTRGRDSKSKTLLCQMSAVERIRQRAHVGRGLLLFFIGWSESRLWRKSEQAEWVSEDKRKEEPAPEQEQAQGT